jgi:hypothetical protein
MIILSSRDSCGYFACRLPISILKILEIIGFPAAIRLYGSAHENGAILELIVTLLLA